MIALLEVAADLVLVAALLMAIAMLQGVKFTLTPVLEAIAVLVGKVPLIGSAAANLVIRGENAVVGAIDDAIKASQAVIAGLFRALIWSWNLMVDSLRDLVDNVESTMDWLANTHVAKVVSAAIGDTVNGLKALEKTVTTLGTDTAAAIGRVETSIKNGLTDVRRDLGGDIAAAIKTAEGAAGTLVSEAERTLRKELHTAVGDAEGIAKDAVNTLQRAEETAVSNLGTAIINAEAGAEAFASGLVTKTAGTLAGLIDAADRRAADAEATLTGGVSDVTDHLRDLLGKLSPADAAALLASIPALAVLVHTIADESGLGRAETRGKVKAICSIDPDVWAELVGAFILFDGLPTLRELVDVAGTVLHDVEHVVVDLVRRAA